MRTTLGCLVFLFLAACANVIPPTGGPPDQVAPQLVSSILDSITAPKKSYRIDIQFDENIELKQNSSIFYFPGGFKPNKAIARKQTLQLEFDSLLSIPGFLDWDDAVRDVNNQNPSSSQFLIIDPLQQLPKDSLVLSFQPIVQNANDFPFWLEIKHSNGLLIRKKKIEKSASTVLKNLSFEGCIASISRKENGDTLGRSFQITSNPFQVLVGLPFGDEKVFGLDSSLDAQVVILTKENLEFPLYEFREGKWFKCRPQTSKCFSAISGKVTLGYFASAQDFRILPFEMKKGNNSINLHEFSSPSSAKQ
jgi:hypothetical protein